MDKEYFVKLTARLYRLTLFFPQDDPLRIGIRKLGADILTNLVFILEGAFYQSRDLINNAQKDIEALVSLFGVVKTMDWVDASDLLEIQREYSKIGAELRKISEIQSLKIGEIHALQLSSERKELTAKKALLKERTGVAQELEEDEGIELSRLESRPPRRENSQTDESSKNSLLERQQKILEVLQEKGKAQVGDFKDIFPSVTKRTLRRDFRRLLNQGLIERIGERNDTFYQVK